MNGVHHVVRWGELSRQKKWPRQRNGERRQQFCLVGATECWWKRPEKVRDQIIPWLACQGGQRLYCNREPWKTAMEMTWSDTWPEEDALGHPNTISTMASFRPFTCNLYPPSGIQECSLVQVYLPKFLCPPFSIPPPTDRALLTLCSKQRISKLPLFMPLE